jgi:hypothetical protein
MLAFSEAETPLLYPTRRFSKWSFAGMEMADSWSISDDMTAGEAACVCT